MASFSQKILWSSDFENFMARWKKKTAEEGRIVVKQWKILKITIWIDRILFEF